jgi:hypothetical protein
MNAIEENLANRVARIEENERLSSRVLTHKKMKFFPLLLTAEGQRIRIRTKKL